MLLSEAVTVLLARAKWSAELRERKEVAEHAGLLARL